jgi:hypothetical protein
MKNLGNSRTMAVEVAFCPLGNSFTALYQVSEPVVPQGIVGIPRISRHSSAE